MAANHDVGGGVLNRPRNFRNPGSFDYKGYLAENGISALAAVRRSKIARLPGFTLRVITTASRLTLQAGELLIVSLIFRPRTADGLLLPSCHHHGIAGQPESRSPSC